MAAAARNADDQPTAHTHTQVLETDTKKGLDSKPESSKNTHDLSDVPFKLDPFAPEFVPSSLRVRSDQSYDRRSPEADKGSGNSRVPYNRRQNQLRKRLNGRGSRAQQETIRRTVYVTDIDQQVTEERLATLFTQCAGPIVDCRICGDPHSALRFAFVEFAEEGGESRIEPWWDSARFLSIEGLALKNRNSSRESNFSSEVQSEDEREMCVRTVYCANIDKEVSQADVKTFFERTCGEVSRMRLSGDKKHSTRIAFVEFNVAECAIVALNCSGMILGSHPIRVSPSKTPVRPRAPRA